MAEELTALTSSVNRLQHLVEDLSADDLVRPAYPSEWTIAQVLSHLGSGAVITGLRLDATLAGRDLDMGVVQSVWDGWNSKEPAAQCVDALEADQALLSRFGSLTAEQQASLRVSLGPLELDFETFVGMRLSEHTLHTWDIAVVFDDATLPLDATEVILDSLPMTAGFAGHPTGNSRTIFVQLSFPARDFQVSLEADRVTVATVDSMTRVDLELPAEAFVRLVYGRLDPRHTPPFEGQETDLEELRQAFPGLGTRPDALSALPIQFPSTQRSPP